MLPRIQTLALIDPSNADLHRRCYEGVFRAVPSCESFSADRWLSGDIHTLRLVGAASLRSHDLASWPGLSRLVATQRQRGVEVVCVVPGWLTGWDVDVDAVWISTGIHECDASGRDRSLAIGEIIKRKEQS